MIVEWYRSTLCVHNLGKVSVSQKDKRVNCSLTKCTCKQTNFVFSCILGGSPDGAKLKLYAQAFKHHLGELKDKDCMIMGLQKVVFRLPGPSCSKGKEHYPVDKSISS